MPMWVRGTRCRSWSRKAVKPYTALTGCPCGLRISRMAKNARNTYGSASIRYSNGLFTTPSLVFSPCSPLPPRPRLVLKPRHHFVGKQFQRLETLVALQYTLAEQEEHLVEGNMPAGFFNQARDRVSIPNEQRGMALAKG